jgi:hypothetical protein
MAFSERKRKYPAQEFFALASAARRYIDLTHKDKLVRRDVAVALKNLAACLEVRRKGVPDAVVLEAHRLESLFFDGYDPYFDGDEPPGCRADKTVRLVGNFTYSGPPGPNTLGLGIRSRPENRSALAMQVLFLVPHRR